MPFRDRYRNEHSKVYENRRRAWLAEQDRLSQLARRQSAVRHEGFHVNPWNVNRGYSQMLAPRPVSNPGRTFKHCADCSVPIGLTTKTRCLQCFRRFHDRQISRCPICSSPHPGGGLCGICSAAASQPLQLDISPPASQREQPVVYPPRLPYCPDASAPPPMQFASRPLSQVSNWLEGPPSRAELMFGRGRQSFQNLQPHPPAQRMFNPAGFQRMRNRNTQPMQIVQNALRRWIRRRRPKRVYFAHDEAVPSGSQSRPIGIRAAIRRVRAGARNK